MTPSKPEFHLRRVFAEGGAGPVEVYPVLAVPAGAKMSRRGFLGAGVAVSTVLTLAGGCGPPGRAGNVVNAHTSTVAALAVTPDGKTLISGGRDSRIKFWSLPDGKLLQNLTAQSVEVNALAVAPDGKTLASGGGNRYAAGPTDHAVRLWSLPDGSLLQTLNGYAADVLALAVTPDGKTLASGANDGTVKIWSLPDGKLLQTWKAHDEPVYALAATDGKTLASASRDGMVKLWSLPAGELLRSLDGHVNSVTNGNPAHASEVFALAVTPDGKTLASASYEVKLWSLPDGKLLQTLPRQNGPVEALAVTPDGKTLAASVERSVHTVQLWSLPEGEPLQTLNGRAAAHVESHVQSLAVTPDGKLLASGDFAGVVILWDLAAGKLLGFLFDPAANETDALVYNVTDPATGRTVAYTIPCGSPLPAGATCTCNCVPGTHVTPIAPSGGGGGGCTCDSVCTCVPVCQAHRVLHPDPVVREMAEQLLLLMGVREAAYIRWAADNVEPALATRLHEILTAIRADARPDPDRWPSPADCAARLDDPDEVVAIMAAQVLRHCEDENGRPIEDRRRKRVYELLQAARERPWFVRSRAPQPPLPDRAGRRI